MVYPSSKVRIVNIVGELEEVRENEIIDLEQMHAENLAQRLSYEAELKNFEATKDWHLGRVPFK